MSKSVAPERRRAVYVRSGQKCNGNGNAVRRHRYGLATALLPFRRQRLLRSHVAAMRNEVYEVCIVKTAGEANVPSYCAARLPRFGKAPALLALRVFAGV